MIRRPGLLAADLSETARLEPTAASLTLKMIGAGEAALTLAEDAPTVHVHDWVSMYTGQGLAGIFRVTNVAQTYRRQIEVSLLHGIDILSDSVWAAQTTFTGTKAQFLTQLLNQQTQLINGVKPWQLGRCEDSGSIERDINYDRLSTLLEALEAEGSNYYFVYDQTTWPWTIHYVAKANTVSSEFRLARNIRTATVTYNDADLCTRLYLSVSSKNEDTVTVKKANPNYISDEATPGVPALVDTNITVSSTDSAVRTYDNTAAQAIWGIVVKTADIDTHDDIQEQHFPSADAWAANYLALRAEPSVQIQIDGDTLRELTGNEWDESDIGALCQVALPEYGHTFREYVVTVTYPDLVRDESHVTISLANTLPKVSESIAMARSEAKTAARASRATARTAADAKEVTSWSQIVQYHAEALDGSGVLTLYESGIDMDATGGVKIYSLSEGIQGLYSEVKVNADEIYAESQKINLVIKDGAIDAGSIVGAINNQRESIVVINADRVNIDGNKSVKISDALFIADGGAFWVKRNATFGKTAGSLVTINNGTVNAPTIQVNSGGSLTFSPSTQSDSALSLTRATVAGLVTDVHIAGPTENDQTYTLEYKKIGTADTWNPTTVKIPVAASSGLTDASVASNILTITKSDGTTVNFRKAVSLTGEWGSRATPESAPVPNGTLYVKATQTNRNTTTGEDETTTVGSMDIHLHNAGHWGSASTQGENVNTYYYRATASQGSSATMSETGLSFEINATDRYTAGQDSVVSTFETAASVPTGVTATDLLKGTVRRYHVTKDGTDVVDSYYRVPNYSATLTAATTSGTKQTLSEGVYALYVTKDGTAEQTPIAYYEVPASPVTSGTITDIILRSPKVSYSSTTEMLTVNLQATGTDISNAPFNDSVSLSVSSTVMYLTKGSLTSTDTDASGNVYKGTYNIGRNSGGVFKIEGIDTLSASVNTLSLALELAVPTCTLTTNGTANWNSTTHAYNYGLTASLSVDGTGHTLKRQVNGLTLIPSDAYDYGKTLVTIDTVTLGTITASAGMRTAVVSTTVKLSNGETKTTDVDVSTIYNAGLDGGPTITSAPFVARLVDNNGNYVSNRQKTVDVSAIYQKGVDDAAPATEEYVYAYSSSNNGGVYLRPYAGASGIDYIGQLFSNTKVKLISYADGWAYVYYSGYYGYLSCSNGIGPVEATSGYNWVYRTAKNSNVVETGWAIAPSGGGDDPTPGKTITRVDIENLIHKGTGSGNVYFGNVTIALNHRYQGSGSQTSAVNMGYDSYGSGYTKGSVGTYFGTVPYTSYTATHPSSTCDHNIDHKALLYVTYSDGTEAYVLIQFTSYPT